MSSGYDGILLPESDTCQSTDAAMYCLCSKSDHITDMVQPVASLVNSTSHVGTKKKCSRLLLVEGA